MQHETEMYEALVDADLGDVIPRFRGYSTYLGVATSCVGRGLDDFDDIGLDNLSDSLQESAIHCVMPLSSSGVLHNDIDLRNITCMMHLLVLIGWLLHTAGPAIFGVFFSLAASERCCDNFPSRTDLLDRSRDKLEVV